VKRENNEAFNFVWTEKETCQVDLIPLRAGLWQGHICSMYVLIIIHTLYLLPDADWRDQNLHTQLHSETCVTPLSRRGGVASYKKAQSAEERCTHSTARTTEQEQSNHRLLETTKRGKQQ
jgi:hypothetical protein